MWSSGTGAPPTCAPCGGAAATTPTKELSFSVPEGGVRCVGQTDEVESRSESAAAEFPMLTLMRKNVHPLGKDTQQTRSR